MPEIIIPEKKVEPVQPMELDFVKCLNILLEEKKRSGADDDKTRVSESDLNEATKDKMKEVFQCEFCIDLISTPVECHLCNQIFCKACMDSWLKQGNVNCPHCR